MFKWNPSRPFAVMDIEATGANPRTDRIVELAIVRILPSGERDTHAFRVNPLMPIPPEVVRIHGITNEDVAACPIFDQLAAQIAGILENCDLGGFNIARFDIPLLSAEFERCNMSFSLEGRRIIDAQRIFHRREPRDLSAALNYYCNDAHLNAHGAEADVLATIRVLEGQFNKYPDLPRDFDELDRYCFPRDPAWADRAGRLKWVGGEIVINFGKKAGQTLRSLIENDSSFVKWMLRSDFPFETQEIIRSAVAGKYPSPPSDSAASGAAIGSDDP